MNNKSSHKNKFSKKGSSGFKKLEEPSQKRDSVLGSLLHSEHIVTIEKMAIGGNGVARIDFKDKKIVAFVEKSAPGDKLKIKITETDKNFLIGTILEIIEPSSSRRTPPCEYASQCGGCSWQQITDEEQLNQKEILLKELFAKFLPGISYKMLSTVQSPKLFNYRNRIQLKAQNGLIGYYKDSTHELIPIDSCLIADDRINSEIPKLKQQIKPSDSFVKYELKLNQNNQYEQNRIGQKGEGLSFAQVNTELNTLLVKKVVDLVHQINPTSLTELYAGSGNFTFEICQSNPNSIIEAVELNSDLTAAAIKKLTSLNLQKKINYFTTDCDSFVKRRNLSANLVLLDPPRAGCSEIVIQKIAEQIPNDLIYISCHPVSLVRDLQKLNLKALNYEIKEVQIFNMFPQTDHFETLVWLTKNQT